MAPYIVESCWCISSFCDEKSQTINLHIIICYTPTYRSQRIPKDGCFNNLPHVLNTVPSGDRFVILDFNARVGSHSENRNENEWASVRGPHRFRV